tara:strand:- start:79 stop:429 length:351 start_codon:yes stop_codon:yes gene_type:complete
MTFKMQSALNIYLENIKIDYEKTCSSSQMKQEFNEGLHYAKGKKYIKVISGDRNGHKRVHSFISMGDDRFQEGDILLAASWATPAKNKARGNIYQEYHISWTGPDYLPTGFQKNHK